MNAFAIRQNHYVPVWYQKAFAVGQNSSLHFLNLYPPKTVLRDGKVVVGHPVNIRAPRSCFWAQDLYTTMLGNIY
jgi:hypothetical protein